ncbi:MAG: DASH family cryptochrome [Salibacteraceae bacterium]|nr:DASH family cryptochrome [Salibacteraceae bacterium]
MHNTSIVWIRNDQRLHDNEALTSAIDQSISVLPVYIIGNRLFERSTIGLPRASAIRLNFLKESLVELRKNYQAIGGDMLCLKGEVSESLIEICRNLEINTIFTSAEYTSEEKEEEQKIVDAGINLVRFHQSTLTHLKDLDFEIEKLPNVFTQFRKQVETQNKYRSPLSKPTFINVPNQVDFSNSEACINQHLTQKINYDDRSSLQFIGGETAALKRLKHYTHESRAIANYKETRNQMLGSDYSSKFSAWLANGNLSARQIKSELELFESTIIKNESTYWLVFELLWRDYFKYVSLKYGEKIFKQSGIKQCKIQSNDVENELFNDWKNANTGNPFVDANLLELRLTGFMSNRGRQNAASYLVKDLNVNWQLGAAFFEYCLIDFDASSNYCNWQYVAGVGNDPRTNRYFNTIHQAKRYDPEAHFIKTWLPKLMALSAEEAISPWQNFPNKYKHPIFLKE